MFTTSSGLAWPDLPYTSDHHYHKIALPLRLFIDRRVSHLAGLALDEFARPAARAVDPHFDLGQAVPLTTKPHQHLHPDHDGVEAITQGGFCYEEDRDVREGTEEASHQRAIISERS